MLKNGKNSPQFSNGPLCNDTLPLALATTFTLHYPLCERLEFVQFYMKRALDCYLLIIMVMDRYQIIAYFKRKRLNSRQHLKNHLISDKTV